MELYKYCRKEHMDSMLAHGGVRIGTLFDWRKAHKYGELVGDEHEGYTPLGGNVIFYDWRFVSSLIVDSSVNDQSTEGQRCVHFQNHAFHTPNLFVISTSMTYSLEDHKRWAEKEGYDACYRIRSARLFIKAISSALAGIADRVCAGKVHYYDSTKSNHVFEGTFHPGLVKRTEFGSQFEYRAMWTPKDKGTDITPIILSDTEARKYCSLHRVL